MIDIKNAESEEAEEGAGVIDLMKLLKQRLSATGDVPKPIGPTRNVLLIVQATRNEGKRPSRFMLLLHRVRSHSRLIVSRNIFAGAVGSKPSPQALLPSTSRGNKMTAIASSTDTA